jgi:hypothetical protein
MNLHGNKRMRHFAALVCMIFLSCTLVRAQDVRYNAAQGTDFSKFKTYKWVAIKGAEQPDQITDGQIKQAIDSQLAAKGLSKVDTDNADLYIGYQVSINQEQQFNTYDTGGGYWRYGGGMSTTTTSTIQIGTLAVDIYEAAAKQLVWRGAASKTLDPKAKPDKRQNNLNKAMAKLFKNYPPPVKK